MHDTAPVPIEQTMKDEASYGEARLVDNLRAGGLLAGVSVDEQLQRDRGVA